MADNADDDAWRPPTLVGPPGEESLDRAALIDAVLGEVERVWPDGFGGEFEAYDWLLEHYGITEHEDVAWQLVLDDSMDDLWDVEDDEVELLAWLADDGAVCAFLREFLAKYRSSAAVYRVPRPPAPRYAT